MTAEKPVPPESMRVGDQERDDVRARLASAHSLGQLDLDELDERVRLATEAKTRGQLADLVHDLPAAPGPARRTDVRSWATTALANPWARVATVAILVGLSLGAGAAATFAMVGDVDGYDGGVDRGSGPQFSGHEYGDGHPMPSPWVPLATILLLLIVATTMHVARRRRRSG